MPKFKKEKKKNSITRIKRDDHKFMINPLEPHKFCTCFDEILRCEPDIKACSEIRAQVLLSIEKKKKRKP
jgi:predicted nucleic acid-binding Zn ribbon protein